MQRLKKIGRNILQYITPKLSQFRLIPPPTIRENGISVTIRIKNEIDWIGKIN